MFRVSKTEERLRTVITLDGQLAGDGIEVVEACCDQEMTRGRPVDLMLRELTGIDQRGRALLCRLAEKGVHVTASGIYGAYIVQRMAPAGHRGE